MNEDLMWKIIVIVMIAVFVVFGAVLVTLGITAIRWLALRMM